MDFSPIACHREEIDAIFSDFSVVKAAIPPKGKYFSLCRHVFEWRTKNKTLIMLKRILDSNVRNTLNKRSGERNNARRGHVQNT